MPSQGNVLDTLMSVSLLLLRDIQDHKHDQGKKPSLEGHVARVSSRRCIDKQNK